MAQTPSDLRTDADLIVRGLKGRVIHIFHYISLGCSAKETDQACSGVAYVDLSNIIYIITIYCSALLQILYKVIKGNCRPQTRSAVVVRGKLACFCIWVGVEWEQVLHIKTKQTHRSLECSRADV